MAVYFLTESDKKQLADLLEKERKNPRPIRGPVGGDTGQAPEVYVARTPRAGIPALTEEPGTGSGEENDQPGSADCYVYQLIKDGSTAALQRTGIYPKTVHNLSNSAIDGDSWVIAVRDKFGAWYAVVPISGFTGCRAVYNECERKTEYWWFTSGIMELRSEPCPECVGEGFTGTGTGTDTPIADVTITCPDASIIQMPRELCLRLTRTLGAATACEEFISTPIELSYAGLIGGFIQYHLWKGSSKRASSVNPARHCYAEFELKIYVGSTGDCKPYLTGRYTLFDIGDNLIGFSFDEQANTYTLGANTSIIHTHVGYRHAITNGPCAPCASYPVVTVSTYSITGSSAYVTITGSGFSSTASLNTVTFNLGAAGTVTEVNAAGTQLTVLFTVNPTATGNLTAVVSVRGCTSGNPVQVATVVEPLTGITITGLGGFSSGTLSVASLTYAVTVVDDSLLVVNVALFGNVLAPTVTYAGNAMTLVAFQDTTAGVDIRAGIYRLAIAGGIALSGNVVITPTSNCHIQSQALNVTGLADNTDDTSATAIGTTETTMNIVGTIGTTVDDTAVIAMFATDHMGSGAVTWNNGFFSGSQDLNVIIANTISTVEGRKITDTVQTVSVSITVPGGYSPTAWAGVVVAFR